MQGLFKQLAGAVGFNEATADRIGEVAMHGLPRAVGLDLSASMGADNLLTFGSPRTMVEQGTIEWLFKQGLGAAGSMAWDTGKDLINGDYRLKPLWPKILQDIDQAIQIGTEGAKSKRTGEVYGEPVSLPAAIAKGAGFQPASEAERFERGGSGRAAKKLKQLHDEKSAIMKKWDNANASGKSRIYNEDVQEWNATHSGKDRINYHDLLASHRSRERRKKQVEEAQAEEE
jgi:hypothetical protein